MPRQPAEKAIRPSAIRQRLKAPPVTVILLSAAARPSKTAPAMLSSVKMLPQIPSTDTVSLSAAARLSVSVRLPMRRLSVREAVWKAAVSLSGGRHR